MHFTIISSHHPHENPVSAFGCPAIKLLRLCDLKINHSPVEDISSREFDSTVLIFQLSHKIWTSSHDGSHVATHNWKWIAIWRGSTYNIPSLSLLFPLLLFLLYEYQVKKFMALLSLLIVHVTHCQETWSQVKNQNFTKQTENWRQCLWQILVLWIL